MKRRRLLQSSVASRTSSLRASCAFLSAPPCFASSAAALAADAALELHSSATSFISPVRDARSLSKKAL